MPKAASERKLDLFEVLRNISTKNRDYYSSLKEEQRKEFSPYLTQRWLSGTPSARQVFFLNEVVNPYVFSLQKYPELLIYLMMICTSGKYQKYKWMPFSKKKTSSTPTLVRLIKDYFGYSSAEAMDALPLLEDNVLLEYAAELGYQKDDVKNIKKELKKRA